MHALKLLVISIILGFVIWLGWIFIESFSQAEPGVKAAIITFIGAVIGTLYANNQTKKREINARHFAEKREAYLQLANIIFNLGNTLGKNAEAELPKQLFEFKKQLLVWGSAEAIKVWADYEANIGKQKSYKDLFMEIDVLLRIMRKELGHDDRTLKQGLIVGMLVKPDERHRVLSTDSILAG